MSDRAYIVAAKRRDGKPPALAKGIHPLQGSDLGVWFDRADAEFTAAGMNADAGKDTWGVYYIDVEVKADDSAAETPCSK